MQGRTRQGYGVVGRAMRIERAHRVAYELANGFIDSTLDVCHTCDNPPCCNPAHLWQGTAAENIRDMFAKGRNRHVVGEAHHKSKLTLADVLDIRSSNDSQRALARRYGVSKTAIRDILRRKNWRHAA